MKRLLLCILPLLMLLFQPDVKAAPQPVRLNYICASGGVGGFQSSVDDDVGQVRLHTTLRGNVPDGRYYVTMGGWTTGGNYFRDVLLEIYGGVVTYGQDVVLFSENGFYVGMGGTFGALFVTAGQPWVGGERTSNDGFVVVDGDHYDCCSYGCSGTGDLSANIECYDYRRSNPNPNPNPHTDADRNAATTAAYRTAHYAGRQERAEMRRKRWHGALQRA